MSSVAIIDYGSGNLRSAAKAFEKAASALDTGPEVIVTADPEIVRQAGHIVLPGVGAFADCRAGLDAVPGMVEVLEEKVRRLATPFFGICVGMQLLATEGREKVVTRGLGWIPGAVERITPVGDLKVPHMGWNTLAVLRDHPVLAGIPEGPDGLHAYFVHSYHLRAEAAGDVAATAEYGGTITAAVARDTVFGTQFHPEKSQALGQLLIANFLRWRP